MTIFRKKFLQAVVQLLRKSAGARRSHSIAALRELIRKLIVPDEEDIAE
jgi:hypothetical protein